MRFGRRSWTVVGVFEAGGSSFESEVWGDVHSLQEDANRGTVFNSVRLKLAGGADTSALIERVANDPRINLQAKTESDYYREQSAVASQVRVLGLLVAGIMGFGAGAFSNRLRSAKDSGELPSEFDAEGVAQIIATYLQGLFRTALLSYDRSQLERQIDLFLTSLGL